MEQVQRHRNARPTLFYDIRGYAIIFCLLAHFSFGQTSIESLQYHLKNTADTATEDKINVLNDLTWEYIYRNTDTALYYGFQALNLAETNKERFPNAVSNTYGTVAILYDIQGDNKRALELYLKSLQLKESLQDSSGIANVKTNIGALFFTQGDFSKALPYFNEALEIETNLKDTISQIGSLINISVIFKNQEQYVPAKQYLFSALELSKLIGEDGYLGKIYNNLGAQFLALDELDSAQHYFELGRRKNLLDQDVMSAGIAVENLASIRMRKGDISAAKSLAFEALNIAKENNFYQLLTNSNETLYEIYLSNKEMDSAFYYKSKYETLNDSILSKENKLIVDELEAQYEIQKSKTEVLAKDAQIKEEQKNSTIYFTVMMSILVLAIVLTILIWSKVKSNRQLADKNKLIERSLAEKEVLMREIHHRVKNNIQAIKSIINIQKRKATEKSTQESLNQTLNRVNAMAVIHDRLYRQKNLTELTSDQYLKELLSDILQTFDIAPNDPAIHVNLTPYLLETDQLLTLGLVFNELITNACKYGKDQDGVLHLTVTSKVIENTFTLKVSDKGSGSDFNSKGFGNELIMALMHKLNGKISYLSEAGFTAMVEIPIND